MSKISAGEVKSIALSYDKTSAKVLYKDDQVVRVVDIPSASAFMEAVTDKISSGEFDLTVEEESGWSIF